MSRAIFTIAYFTFLEAARARLTRLLLLVLLAAFGGSVFLQSIAIADSQRIQTAFLAALLRPASVFVLSLFIISSLSREFNEKGLELILSLDLPRASYVIGKLLGFMGIALLFAAAISLLLVAFAPSGQVALWGISLLCELWIMTALSVFCIFTFSQIMPAMSLVLGFYLLARAMSAIQLIGHTPLNESGMSQQFMVHAIDGIALFLPRLDIFTQTAWLVNATGSWPQLGPILAQTAIYLALLTAGALFDLSRKNF
ncbi:MAG: hypothetical protein ABFE02_15035 [Sulfuricella sp.]